MLDVTRGETLRSENVQQHAETENIVEEIRQYWKEHVERMAPEYLCLS